MSDDTVETGQPAQGNTVTSLLDSVVDMTRIKPTDDAYAVTKEGLQFFLKDIVKPEHQGTPVSSALVDQMISEIDHQLSVHIDAILHHAQFQAAESTWRGLKFLVDSTDFRENIRIEFMNVSKQDLLEDFEDSPEVVQSGLYRRIYTAEYGQFGGKPYGLILGNYDFGPGAQDMKLMKYMASVSAMSHAPFIAAAAPSFFGIDKWADLPALKDLSSVFEGAQYAAWRSFRASEDARYVGLTLPKFLLRLPYGDDTTPVSSFNYTETVSDADSDFCWGNTALAFANRVTDSFAHYRWCSNIIGPKGGGTVNDLPLFHFESKGETKTKIPTQVLVSERREFELAEAGFIALTMRKGSDNAAFFSANSCQQPKVFANTPEGKEAELNYRLSTQLPYMMIMNRLAHYIKVLQRENIGSWRERQDLERELSKWISQYVTEMDNPDASTRSRRPLRMAQIAVKEVPGNAGWYSVDLKARPHFKYMGASFTLSLAGKLEKQ